jgi:acyl-CoA synthetase (AMP-forming)/AMP-acid ligase II
VLLQMTQGLHRAVQRRPHKLATISGQRQHTYLQFADRVARLAAALQKLRMTRTEELGAELMQHCRQLIAGYKCPRSVEFRDALPMTGAGKIQKVELRKPYWEGKDRRVN